MSTPTAPAAFDLRGRLPSGTVVLEASAGTGKTFTIAALVARWVAETELALPDLLVVTFTRAATAELRDRVRRRLVDAGDHLDAVLAGAAPDDGDPVHAVLAATDPAELARRRRRLRKAVTDVDAATIATIHGFCRHVLDGMGIASDLDRGAELVEDVFDLVDEVVDDLLVTTYLEVTDLPRFGRNDLVKLGRDVVAHPTTRLAPRGSDDPAAGLRLHLAQRIRTEVAARARRRRLLTYDDLLTRLKRTLHDPDLAAAARHALRSRYRVALVDEFQDTDPVQWDIMSQAFTDDPAAGPVADPVGPSDRQGEDQGRALVLIGDPKQAIYSFRGADVHAYLGAVRCSQRQTLGTSWRADAGLLRAFDALFGGARFGHPDIPYRHVEVAPGHDTPGLVGAPGAAPLRLRHVPRHPSLPIYHDKPAAGKVRDLIAADLAADVAALLDARPELITRDRDGRPAGRRTLAPGDIAVLVRSHDQAAQTQKALQQAEVPAVVGGAGSVFASAAATDWRRLLDALERPAAALRARALALSVWVGWRADQLAAADERAWDQLHDDVHYWARLLREHGVAATVRAVRLQRQVARRLLGTIGGERLLADLEHIGELAHAHATAEHLGAAGLAAWLRDRMREAADDTADDRLRRLETDADAVQVLTVHRSKGLEFPVVYCPFAWSSSTGVRGAPMFHDAEGRPGIDVGGSTHPAYADHAAAAEQELRAEELRLLYVAMTRAKHRVVAWYAPAGMPEWSGLGRVLLCRDAAGDVEADRPAPLLDDDAIAAALTDLAERSEGTIAVETVPETPPATQWRPDPAPDVELDRARFTRSLDDTWRRTSYSALTRLDEVASHLTPLGGAEPAVPVKDDEPPTPGPATTATPDDDPDGLREVELPLAAMPGGTQVGTVVHHVLEHTGFAAADLTRELALAFDGTVPHAQGRAGLDRDEVVAGLHAALTTPLGATAGGGALRGVTAADRRNEVEFELPLDRSGDGGRAATVDDLARLMAAHLPATDPLAGYPATLPAPLRSRSLRGFLAGSIDLVWRRDTEHGPVFHVADYKTNRLGIWGEPLTAWDYRQDALADAMGHGHYPIQGLLYAVALHRMLRWRLPDYDPGRHLGSVLYLFVRGMAGPATPAPGGQPCGVFAWQPPATLVTAASDLLHGVAR